MKTNIMEGMLKPLPTAQLATLSASLPLMLFMRSGLTAAGGHPWAWASSADVGVRHSWPLHSKFSPAYAPTLNRLSSYCHRWMTSHGSRLPSSGPRGDGTPA